MSISASIDISTRDQKILDRLEEIIEEGQVLNDKNRKYGNREDYMKMANVVFEFVKKKGLILYGGEAIDKNLKNKKKPGIYTSKNKPDYDFYSPDYERDAIELCNLLHDKGFKYVRARSAIHRGTLRVQANTEWVADISYMPKNIFVKIPKVKINGAWYISSNFVVKNFYHGLIKPRSDVNYARWEKDYTRLQKFTKVFPLNYPSKFSDKWRKVGYSDTPYAKNKTYIKATKMVNEKLIKKDPQILVTGEGAYQFFVSENKSNGSTYHEIYSTDNQAERHCKKVVDLLKKNFPKTAVAVDVYEPFYTDLPPRLRVKMNDWPVIDIYSIGHQCVATLDDYKHVNYYQLMSFLYSQFFYHTVYPTQEQFKAPIVVDRIIKLKATRDMVLKKKNLTGFEPESGKFRVLGYECVGEQKSDPEISWEEKKAGAQQIPMYFPEFHRVDPKKFKSTVEYPEYSGQLVIIKKVKKRASSKSSK